MSVEAHELMGDDWTRWQGHRVNGAFPLGRVLGSSGHSGVFLTKSGEPHAREVAIKLVPASQGSEALQLPRWTRAGGLAHPHLLRLLESGACQLDGLPYLFVVMEYADQTLAQLLQQRALTAEEAREMLLPILDALAYLHAQGLVQGQLKPTNILVVGDQLKLASDTIRPATEAALVAPSAYEPPPGLDRPHSTSDDVWALGLSLFEALTRRSPPSSGGHRSSLALPPDFSPPFRDIVARCLKPKPQDRPPVTELLAWAGGRPAHVPPVESLPPAVPDKPEPRKTLDTVPPADASSQSTPAATRPPELPVKSPKRMAVAAMLAAVVVLPLGWRIIPALRSHRALDTVAARTAGDSLPQATGGEPLATPQPRSDIDTPVTARHAEGDATQPVALHQVIPAVSPSAARTLRGHIEVSVRASVRPDGSVSSVVAVRNGPSRYFRRLAVDAAKQWTFTPANDRSARPVKILFDFSRDSTEGHTVPLH